VRYEELLKFIERDMRMSHVYQPIMLRVLLTNHGRASRQAIARHLLNSDESQLDYYSEIVRDMVGRVLTKRGVVKRDGVEYVLPGFDQLKEIEVEALQRACDAKLSEYLERRGEAIWQHRKRSGGFLSGTVKYEVLKRAMFRCELCGIPATERALEVDHIKPRNKGGTDEIANLQALCYSCNAMKRDRDDTDFRAVRESLDLRQDGCSFCEVKQRPIVHENSLCFAIEDRFPVTDGHLLIIPKRHEQDYFRLGLAELRATTVLLTDCRERLVTQDRSIVGFNVGVNSGTAAGQTVMHCHIHLIPRRNGDCENPRGGVRGVISGKADYGVSG
jgi:diadenosine tetraphosphate (Ap4A) HIT family hydrolase/5-methylcytosine-specific restriction endonuclease McrA